MSLAVRYNANRYSIFVIANFVRQYLNFSVTNKLLRHLQGEMCALVNLEGATSTPIAILFSLLPPMLCIFLILPSQLIY